MYIALHWMWWIWWYFNFAFNFKMSESRYKERYFNNERIIGGLSASELTVLGKIGKRGQQWQMAAKHLRRIGP